MQTDEKRAAFIACSKKLLDYFIPFVYDKHRTKGKNGAIFCQSASVASAFYHIA